MENIILIIDLLILLGISWLIFINNKKTNPSRKTQPIFVDTSVLIDGRIMSLVESGLLVNDIIYIPRSVVRELQLMADGSDSEKRAKARAGLDLVSLLQSLPHLNVEIYDDAADAREGVDERLLSLCKKHNGILLSIDFNLLKVANIEAVKIINLNELAKNIRINHLPGEKFTIELTQKGSDPTQGVGYLSDGTMVVVEDARQRIGHIVDVECTRSLQTAAGRMMFARILKHDKPQSKPKTQYHKKRNHTKVSRSQSV